MRRLNKLIVLCGVCLFITAPCLTAEENVNPDINRHYQNPDFSTWQQRFERAGREVYDYRHDIVSAIALQPQTVIADVGAGTGLFTLLFAQAVPRGHVYAVDISSVFIDKILQRAKHDGLNNISGVVNTQKSVNLAENSLDIVFLSDTYHHFEYPQTILQSIHKSLRAKGRLLIIDFRKDADVNSGWVMRHTRLNQQQVIKEIMRAGFVLVKEYDFLKENYFLEFRKAH